MSEKIFDIEDPVRLLEEQFEEQLYKRTVEGLVQEDVPIDNVPIVTMYPNGTGATIDGLLKDSP